MSMLKSMTVSAAVLAALLYAAGPALAQGGIYRPADGDVKKEVPAPGLDEYSSVPEGMLAPWPDKNAKPVVVQKQNALPQNFGDIPGVFEIPGASGQVEQDTGVMSMEQVMAAYKEGKYELVLKNLQPMADNKQHQAEQLLGIMYLQGQGVPKDTQKALGFLNRAADANMPAGAALPGA